MLPQRFQYLHFQVAQARQGHRNAIYKPEKSTQCSYNINPDLAETGDAKFGSAF